MHATLTNILAIALALAGSVQPSVIRLEQRAPFYFGWHATTQAKAEQMQKAGTMLYLGNSQKTNQLGPGVYLSEKLGAWSGEVVCLFAADESKVAAAEKVKYPAKNRAGKNIQWDWTNYEGKKQGKYIQEYFQDVGADMATSLRLSDWDNGIQLKVPEAMCGTANPLEITIVECAPYADKDSMKNKDVVVDFKSWPGWKGWLASEPVPAADEAEACKLDARGNTSGSGCSSSQTSSSTSAAPSTTSPSSTSAASSTKATSSTKVSTSTKATSTTKVSTSSKAIKKTTSSKKPKRTPA
ncbi:hypothetical protein M406DRAFT_76140 [Cryphonectria parasitica EP155]|uniref:Uncharacterized protein n=1 Tax=Cryphonectria parasitica (strain ATCC 38755 / EP155) TaxID=660469 RepID=A0A9P5CPP0_CRYP1|nr:uncharacterized protein M406DRAFT_76140 [Cryphonectria parasitica EP155]KAF3766684.1 hypothetical protein M406DRAFT_76140 [Cryphonectria parasitica EP155]